jgi:hypothetical protein
MVAIWSSVVSPLLQREPAGRLVNDRPADGEPMDTLLEDRVWPTSPAETVLQSFFMVARRQRTAGVPVTHPMIGRSNLHEESDPSYSDRLGLFRAIAQRRYSEGNDIEPKEEIFRGASGLDFGFQRPVGRRYYPHVSLSLGGFAQPLLTPVVQEA